MGAAPQPHDRPTRAGQKAQAAVGTILSSRGWGRAASDSAACRAEGRRGGDNGATRTAPPGGLEMRARPLPPASGGRAVTAKAAPWRTGLEK